jgi:hypothetical protein
MDFALYKQRMCSLGSHYLIFTRIPNLLFPQDKTTHAEASTLPRINGFYTLGLTLRLPRTSPESCMPDAYNVTHVHPVCARLRQPLNPIGASSTSAMVSFQLAPMH